MNPTIAPRVLVVAENDVTSKMVEDLGHTVARCAGPRGSTCPMVDDGGCAIVDAASGIVFELDLDDPHNAEILRCYRRNLGPLVPIVVITDNSRRNRHTGTLEGIPSVPELDSDELAEFVDRAELAAVARRALSEIARRRSSNDAERIDS